MLRLLLHRLRHLMQRLWRGLLWTFWWEREEELGWDDVVMMYSNPSMG